MWDIPFQRTVRERQPAAPKGVLGAIHRPAPRFVYRTVQPLQIGPVCTSTAAGIVLFCSCLLEHAWCRAVRKRLLFLGVLGGGGLPFGVPCRSCTLAARFFLLGGLELCWCSCVWKHLCWVQALSVFSGLARWCGWPTTVRVI